MGETIQFARPDGQKATGYLALPRDQKRAPGVVVIQEWWGLNPQIQGVAERLAAAGFRAVVPDLYRGKLAQTPDEASHLMSGLDWGMAAEQDVRGAAQHLKDGGAKAAALGFCMGGALTIIAAVKVPEVDAAVCFYGIPPGEAADPAKIRVPFLGHFASDDDWCTPSAVDHLETAMQEGRVQYDLFRYKAKHAFFNEARPEVFDASASATAWDRSIAFLRRNLG